MTRIIKPTKIIKKESPERKSASIISDFKKYLNQDSIYEEYEVLLSDKDLWALMQIPFSTELAEVTEEISEQVKPGVEKKVAVSSKDEQIIREAIARKLNKAPSQLTDEDYKNVNELDLSSASIKNIEFLAKLTNLQSLVLWNTQVSNIGALSGLANLQSLDLDGTQVSDIGALSGLINMQSLFLNSIQVSDISILTGLTKLQGLYLSNTQVSDISALSSLTNLQSLSLDSTQVSDISALSRLTNLQELSLHTTRVSDISALSGLTKLRWLNLSSTQVSNEQVTELKKILPKCMIER